MAILAKTDEVYEINPLSNDLLQSFFHSKIEDTVYLKMKKNRRKHLRERDRLIKIGVLKRSSSTSKVELRKSKFSILNLN